MQKNMNYRDIYKTINHKNISSFYGWNIIYHFSYEMKLIESLRDVLEQSTLSNLPTDSAKKSSDWIINFWVNYNFKRKQKYIQLYKHYIQTFKVPWIPILEDIWQLARMMIENLEHLKYHSIVDKCFRAPAIAITRVVVWVCKLAT